MKKPTWIIINSSYDQGGASVAAKRLAISLSQLDYKVIFIFTNPQPPNVNITNSSINIVHIPQNPIKRRVGSLVSRIFSRISNKHCSILLFSNLKLVNFVNSFDYAIVNLHWIHNQSLSFSDIKKVRHKVIWTCHDAWPFSVDFSHYPGNSNFLVDHIFHFFYQLHSYFLRNLMKNVYYVCPSSWLNDIARSFPQISSSVIANPINNSDIEYDPCFADSFAPGIYDPSLLTILFPNPIDPHSLRKGTDLIIPIIKALDSILNSRVNVIVISEKNNYHLNLQNINIIITPFVTSRKQFTSIQKLSNITAVTSRQENLPQVITESQFIGSVPIGFSSTGIPSTIVNNISGLLVKPFNINDFASQINNLILNPSRICYLKKSCIKYAQSAYSPEHTTFLYEHLVEKEIKS